MILGVSASNIALKCSLNPVEVQQFLFSTHGVYSLEVIWYAVDFRKGVADLMEFRVVLYRVCFYMVDLFT